MLRPHVDTFPNRRVLIPLTEQGDNFRHLYGDTCFVMRAGEVWGGDGTSCHGAANVSASGYRVLLLLDVAPDVAEASTPVWFRAPWEVPDEARVFRPSLPRAARHARYETARGLARGGGHNAAEREILLLAFEFDMPAEHAYRELLCFARWMGRSEGPDGEWRGRARALLNPTLPFAVAVPGRTTRRTARAGAAVA
jgi:hypothetical protein